MYTKRILEIISNVDKQNMEIKKILEDTREIQKEINTLEGQLDRCFSIADETLFKVSMRFYEYEINIFHYPKSSSAFT